MEKKLLEDLLERIEEEMMHGEEMLEPAAVLSENMCVIYNQLNALLAHVE